MSNYFNMLNVYNPLLFADVHRLIFDGYSTCNSATNAMSKTLTEAQVTTAKARSRLEPGVHWRRLDAEAHLGYRKGKQGGVWFVRWRNHHEGGNYKQEPVGVANDINDKPADGILTFEQAVRTAREAVARARTEAASQAAGPAPTVRSAVESYVKERDARERRRTGRRSLVPAFLVKKSAAIRKLWNLLLSHWCICMP
jgi:hypothetical protein